MTPIKICLVLILAVFCTYVCGYKKNNGRNKLQRVFAWKQLGYDFNGVCYKNSTDLERQPDSVVFEQELEDAEKFFIQYNNVPIGFEVYDDRVFITVPRRQYGIPSTLNYVSLSSSSPLLRPYPDVQRSRQLVSVYRPRVDVCGRLWAVDTGLLEVPGNRKQVQKPAIVVFDLKTNEQILRYELKDSDLVNERSPAGLTSIAVDVTTAACDDAYAYINDLATEGMVVFSMKQQDSWRISDATFRHDERAMNFTVAGHTLPWRDGLFSIALADPDEEGHRLAYYHALVSFEEFAIDAEVLKRRGADLSGHVKRLGTKGPLTQSGSHGFHSATRVLLYANVAQDAILCWHVDSELTSENVGVVRQDGETLVYISDLKIIKDDVWVLVNQIPRFIYSKLDPNENNFYIYKGNIQKLIRGTPCDQRSL